MMQKAGACVVVVVGQGLPFEDRASKSSFCLWRAMRGLEGEAVGVWPGGSFE